MAISAMGLSSVGCGSSSAGPPSNTESVAENGVSGEISAEQLVAAALMPPPDVEDLVGAAVAPTEPEVPANIEGLSSRMRPRPLSIQPTAHGHISRFTFDGFHRGWFARTSGQRLLTPVYGEGKVYVGGGFSSNRVYAYDARTGERKWSASAPDGGPSAVIVEDGKVLYNTESCTLFAVDAETGRRRWSRWLGDPLMSQPSAFNNLVFSAHVVDGRSPGSLTPGEVGYGTGGGRRYGFTAMNIGNGSPRWTRSISADVMNAAVLDEEDAYFTTMDGVVWRLNQRTGRVRWRRRLRATSAPWLDGDVLHVSVRGRVETADAEGTEGESNRRRGRARRGERSLVLSKENGETLRENEVVPAPFVGNTRPDPNVQAGWAYEGSRATVHQGRVYQTIGNEVHCRSAESGELLWRRRYTDEVQTRPASPPAVAGSQLVFGTQDGVIFGLDVDTGMTTWAYEVGEPITAQPTVAHGWVYASTTRGGVVGLEVSDPSFDGWHMWGGNAQHSGPRTGTAAPVESDDRPSEGTLRLEGDTREGETAAFVLSGTEVDAEVSSFVARVRVTQTFSNPYERPVQATYLFPLPDDAAVDGMEMRAGSRVVHAQIMRRQQARQEYREAAASGVLASLLEQERPNVFRQSVANIRPGDEIRVTLTYTQVLPYEEGSYRFVYPMVAGPRYQPGGQAESEGEEEGDTHQVILAQDGAVGDVRIDIHADLGVQLRGVDSPTHELQVSDEGQSTAHVMLQSTRPDRDLDVRFHVASEAPTVSVVASAPRLVATPAEEGPDEEGADEEGADEQEAGHFALVLHPQLNVDQAQLMPRELVFLVDTSSSMEGHPLRLAKAAIERALGGLRANDTFRVLSFSDDTSGLSDTPLPATEANIERARRFVSGLSAFGATEMSRGLRAALQPAADPQRMRIVLMMTDGYIGNESEIFRTVHQNLGQSRVFAFGVGSAVNRYLLTRLSEVGRGDLQVVTLDESPERAADTFHARIANPWLTDISIDWGDLQVSDAYPRRLPDLYADRPLVVHGRYLEGASGEVTIRGRVGGRAFEQRVQVSLPSSGPARPELSSIWARTRIRDLMTAMSLQPNEALQQEVVALGLKHHLLTQWTAFLAIDEGYDVTPSDDGPSEVAQPVLLPAARSPRSPVRYRRRRMARPARPAVGGLRSAGVDHSLAGALRGRGSAATRTTAAEPEPARPRSTAGPRPTTRGRRRGSGAAARCREEARQPDGSIDQGIFQRCMSRLSAQQKSGDPKRGSDNDGRGLLARRTPPRLRWAEGSDN